LNISISIFRFQIFPITFKEQATPVTMAPAIPGKEISSPVTQSPETEVENYISSWEKVFSIVTGFP
jgi:hypothetical protein